MNIEINDSLDILVVKKDVEEELANGSDSISLFYGTYGIIACSEGSMYESTLGYLGEVDICDLEGCEEIDPETLV